VAARPNLLLLLDSASLYFRAFYGVPDSVRSPDGIPVNAVRGFLEMLASLVGTRRPARVVACWDDDWRPAFRVAALPSYKAHRAVPGSTAEDVPAALTAQVPVLVEVLAAFGIARVGVPGFEADDVIGTLVAREGRRPAGERADAVEVVTGDRDLFQLVDDAAAVRVLYTARGLRNLEVVDEARLREKYGVATGRQYADLAVLRGDPSDGLPGVAGIGEKTAAALVAKFGSLEALLAALDAGDPGLGGLPRRRLLDAAAYLDVAPAVVRIALDAPVGAVDDALPASPAHPDAVVALAERWGLAGPAARLTDAMTAARTG
jgi:5'-3' exonuclease